MCPSTEKLSAHGVSAMLWNTLGHARSELVILPVGAHKSVVVKLGGNLVPSQMLASEEKITNYKRGVAAQGAGNSVAFIATLSPLGATQYTVAPASKKLQRVSGSKARAPVSPPARAAASTTIENEFVRLDFSPETGRLAGWTNKETNTTVQVPFFWPAIPVFTVVSTV